LNYDQQRPRSARFGSTILLLQISPNLGELGDGGFAVRNFSFSAFQSFSVLKKAFVFEPKDVEVELESPISPPGCVTGYA
jgi:hypothetical protein